MTAIATQCTYLHTRLPHRNTTKHDFYRLAYWMTQKCTNMTNMTKTASNSSHQFWHKQGQSRRGGGGVTATDTGQETSISYWNPKAPFSHMRNLWPTVGSFPRQLTTGSVCTGPHRRRLTPHNTTTTAASDWAALGPATGAGHGWRAVTRLSTKMTSASGASGSTGGSRSKSRVVALR